MSRARVALPVLALLLGGCQSAALQPTAVDPACRPLAERYGVFYVALATWDQAQPARRASREQLQAGMAELREQALALGCPAFWEP